METFYHGTYRLFKNFSLEYIGEGEGKSKFGQGVYITSSYASAALYAAKAGKANGVETFYVYTVEVPELTAGNNVFSCKPVTEEVRVRIENVLGEQIPTEAIAAGKLFRKYVGNLLTNQKGTIKQMIGKANYIAERTVSKFFKDNGIIYLAWPQAQTKPDGDTNRAVLDEECIRIVKIEQVCVDAKNRLIEGSQIEIEL
jgi:hypothetical protein